MFNLISPHFLLVEVLIAKLIYLTLLLRRSEDGFSGLILLTLVDLTNALFLLIGGEQRLPQSRAHVNAHARTSPVSVIQQRQPPK